MTRPWIAVAALLCVAGGLCAGVLPIVVSPWFLLGFPLCVAAGGFVGWKGSDDYWKAREGI